MTRYGEKKKRERGEMNSTNPWTRMPILHAMASYGGEDKGGSNPVWVYVASCRTGIGLAWNEWHDETLSDGQQLAFAGAKPREMICREDQSYREFMMDGGR